MSFNHRSVFARTGLSVAVAMSVMSSAAAAEEVYKLGEVVVTAARTAQTVDESLAPVTVINREQIERAQATTVVELLNQSAPGVQISSSGGPGSVSGVYVRGTKTAQTLILMNGQKINTASSGSAPLEYIDPDQIERIEIVRGPRSTLYGADAVGGVINIITRKGSGDPKLTIKAGGGSHGTGEYGLNFGGETDGTRYNLGARLYETQGYDRTITTFGHDGDDDAYRNKSFSGNVSRAFDSGIEAGVNFAHSEGKSEYDVNYADSPQGYPINYFEVSNLNTYLSFALSDIWDSRLESGFQRDHRNDEGPSSSHSTNKRYSFSWINDLGWADNQLLTTGVDYSNDTYAGSSNYVVNERYNTGIFAQNLTSFVNSDLQLGGRYDDNEAFGSEFTGNVSWGVNLPKQMRGLVSYGTAFRAPTFADMYPESAPNPDLKPETAKNTEIELRGVFGEQSRWSVNIYQNDMKDMLNYALRDGKFQTFNVDKARIRGIEFEVGTHYLGWEINTNLTYVDPENRSGANSGKKLHYRAQQMAALNMDKDFGRWSLGGTFRAQGKSWVNTTNTEQLPGFGTVDLRASVELMPQLETQFKVVNLLDKNYQPVDGYRGEPRGVFATLVWSPEL
ncbi:TonB-dependent receptor [Endozoicomonas sp. GU-1]|uniref:TonB-dependent receptor domain-containing protein n=1 Tax=Endozoicomonas sp. GU-1 TaxID=3009078 RepID=UPI0022B4EDEC|nr:TonB-dependent receptor [Endozoicomonas sp. GU-1]WBA80403.1 TonB-dependent receptor [Endozoicomonas sp. GU-1]WBA87967.1 TonB-dependent receptor [Endozoicomonas sp. GU-1]